MVTYKKAPILEGKIRGVALVKHCTLQHTCLHLNTTLGVAVTVYADKRYNVCLMYLSPNSSVDKNKICIIPSSTPIPPQTTQSLIPYRGWVVCVGQ